jgi:hypothetical protein
MVYQENILITLNSKYGTSRNGTKKSLVDFNFTGLLKDDKDILRSYISILNAQIPVSFYTINDYNNVLDYYDNIYNSFLIVVPIGNYNGNTLITVLNAGFASNGHNIIATLSALTGKITFTASGIDPEYAANSSIANVIGLTSNTSGYVVIMQAPLNLLGVKKLSIKSNSLAISSFTSRTGNRTDTICTIPVIEPPFNMISYVNVNDLNKNILRGQIIDSIDIRITDENNIDIDFNNIDWNITLCLSNERIDTEKQNLNIYEAIQQMSNLQNNTNKEDKKLIDEELQLLEK